MSHSCLTVQGRPQTSRFWEYSADNCGSFEYTIRKKLARNDKPIFDKLIKDVKNNTQPDRKFLLSMLDLFKDDYPNEKQYFVKLWKKFFVGKPETIKV